MTGTRMCVTVPQHVRETEKGHRDKVEKKKPLAPNALSYKHHDSRLQENYSIWILNYTQESS